MRESVKEAALLQGQRVAFTGKLATMRRARAIRLVRACGGHWSPTVNRQTTMLVVGQEGWPLQADGRLTGKLRRATAMQQSRPLCILAETSFLERIGIESPADGLRRVSTAQLSRLLNIPGRRVCQWVEGGLVQPCETVQGVHYFDFRQVSWAKTVCEAVKRGVSLERLRRSLRQLQQWLPEASESLAQLSVLEQDGRLLVRLHDQLVEASGQRQLDFGEELQSPPTVPLTPGPQTAADWFDRAYRSEQSGDLAEAEHSYRRALRLGGPDPHTCFNLANVLFALGKKMRAAERYAQVVELDPTYAEAWNNLGTVLEELGDHEEARDAYEQALGIDPFNLDARFNLADLLDQLGRGPQANTHWETYLRQDQMGPWADYARRRLAR
jgi:DNA-binding transcriptional MerR regulator